MVTLAGLVLISYLIGSVPAGYVAGRIAGIDIRKVGSGNVGATNVLRVLGKRFGYAVFLFDFLKGLAAVELSIAILCSSQLAQPSRELCAILAGVSCVIGHSYPVWLRFKGGKGVATSLGVLLAIIPVAALVAIVIWLITFASTRYVSVASMTAALAFPVTVVAMLFLKQLSGFTLLFFSVCLAILIIWRHRSNLSRLISGTEPRFKRR